MEEDSGPSFSGLAGLGGLFAGCSGAPASSVSRQENGSGRKCCRREQCGPAGNAGRKTSSSPILYRTPLAKAPPQEAPVIEQVYEATGVRLKWILPPAEPEERLRVMLASDDLPDLIDFGNGNLTDKTLMKQYKDAGKLLKLNELLRKDAPEILEKTGRISGTRSQTKRRLLLHAGRLSVCRFPNLSRGRHQF